MKIEGEERDSAKMKAKKKIYGFHDIFYCNFSQCE